MIMIKPLKIVDNALKELYRFLAGFFTNNYEIISSFSNYFYRIFGSRNENILIVIYLLIRFIITIAFIIDVFIFFRLNYFYKSLVLLCVSLIINVSIYLLKDFAGNLEDAKSYLVITEESIDPITQIPTVSYQPSIGNKDILRFKDLSMGLSDLY